MMHKEVDRSHQNVTHNSPVILHEPALRRVAAYCRVSTDMEMQEGSFEMQTSYFRDMINHLFYGRVFCGECGEIYMRRTFTVLGKDGKNTRYKAWNCRERQKGSQGNGCRGRTVKEKQLEGLVAAELDWEAFDGERFEREVEHVVVMKNGIRVMRRA